MFSFILRCWTRHQDVRRPTAPICCPPTASSLFPNQIECSCFSIMFTAFISSFSISCSHPVCCVQLPGTTIIIQVSLTRFIRIELPVVYIPYMYIIVLWLGFGSTETLTRINQVLKMNGIYLHRNGYIIL